MSQVMPAAYELSLVALSFVIAAIGAFVALTASARILGARRRISLFNALAAGLALGGIGVWSMHFIGMLALRVGMGISYSLPETVVSLLAAVGGSTAALLWVARDPGRVHRILGAGLLLGLGVVVMHYLGMAGMRFAGFIEWSWPTIALSALIAVVAATAALWLAFSVRQLGARIVAALVMATAVCAMHYTGMEAAGFICTSPNPQGFPQGTWLVSALQLPVLVSIVAMGIAFMIFVDQMLQRVGTARAQAAAA